MVSSTDTEQQKRVKWTTESVDVLSETKPKRIIARRQSQRAPKPKTNSTDYYYAYRPKQTSTVQTRSSDHTLIQAKPKENCSMPFSNCNSQTSPHMDDSTTQADPYNLQKRKKIERTAKKKLPDISEELNVPKQSVKTNSKNLNEGTVTDDNGKIKSSHDEGTIPRIVRNQRAILPKTSEPNEESSPRDTNDSDSDNHNESHSLIVLDDICDVLKENLPKINGNDGTNDPPRKSRRLAQRSMTII